MLNLRMAALFCVLAIVGSEVLSEYKNLSKKSHIKHWKPSKYEKYHQLTSESTNDDRAPRIRFTTGYGEKNGVVTPAVGIGAYAPGRLNFMGALFSLFLGIGASLIFPRLLTVFSDSNGHNGRSSSSDNSTALTDMLKKIDDFLEENKIDSKNCLQRAVCSYMRSTETRIKRGAANEFDQYVHTLSSNSLVDLMLNGTAIKEAMENGKEKVTDECDDIYSRCSLDMSTALKILTKLLPDRMHLNRF